MFFFKTVFCKEIRLNKLITFAFDGSELDNKFYEIRLQLVFGSFIKIVIKDSLIDSTLI